MSLLHRAVAVVQRTGHSRKVSGSDPDALISCFVSSRNRLTWTRRASVWYSVSLEFSFLSCLVFSSHWPLVCLTLVLVFSFSGPDFLFSGCLPLVLFLSLSASGFDPQPVCVWFLILSLSAPWFWFSACLPLILILSRSASDFDPQPFCLWFWSRACLSLPLLLSLSAPGFGPVFLT
jgi:hypothetical protein